MYKHIVQYYETDKMSITHHSNYIRWMEEARIAFLDSIGWSYARLEDEGIISPVTAVEGKYKATSTFADTIEIDVRVEEFKGVRLKLQYVMKKQDGQIVFEGRSEHCFLNEKGMPIRMKREYPAFYEVLVQLQQKD